jgi:hypothetical protein
MPNQVDDVLLHAMDDSELSGAHLTEMLANPVPRQNVLHAQNE